MTLVDGDTTGGGVFSFAECAQAEGVDGRSEFALTSSGQLKMPRLGNYCVTFLGDAALANAAPTADASATSSDSQHTVDQLTDADAATYWASSADSPVDVQLDFGSVTQIKAVEIDWERPAQAFEIQVLNGGGWTTVSANTGNNLPSTRFSGPAVAGTAIRIHMTKAHPTLGQSDGHAVYAIKEVRVLSSAARAVVQDCGEAEQNSDARDKFFMAAVPEFSPAAGFSAQSRAALLRAAEAHLGSLLAKLYSAMPNLAACGFKASLAKASPAQLAAVARAGQQVTTTKKASDAVSVAVAAVGPAVGSDGAALRSLVQSVREALAQVAH